MFEQESKTYRITGEKTSPRDERKGHLRTEELALHHDHRDLFPLERHVLNDCPLEDHGVNS